MKKNERENERKRRMSNDDCSSRVQKKSNYIKTNNDPRSVLNALAREREETDDLVLQG